MKRVIPEQYQLLHTREQIAARTVEIAAEVSQWAKFIPVGQQLLTVCILRGGVYFATDLLRALSVSIEQGFCRSWGYSVTDNSSQLDTVRLDLMGLSPAGRTVLLIDDICDTGTTFQRISNYCMQQGAVECRTVALMHRIIPNQVVQPDWVGFTYAGEEWLVGQGLDDSNTNGNLPDVYCIRK